MKAVITTVVVLIAALGALAIGAVAFGVVTIPGLNVAGSGCSVTVHSENVQDNAIQSAINAYPGGTICVGAGTFPEQLNITSSGTTLKGAGDTKTIIEPSASGLTINTYDYDGTPTPAAAIILVDGSSGTPTTGVTGVTIEELQVNGVAGQTSSLFTGCSQGYIGVDFQASSGTLTGASVTNIQLPPSLFGCQQGLGVYAYNGWFNYAGTNNVPDSVSITHTLVSNYDKNGITCDDPEEACTIASDTVTGIGPTPLIAQNGIQVAFGALGTVESNHVSANGDYTGSTGCSPGDQDAYAYCGDDEEGAGILLYDSDTGSLVSGNTLSLNEYGIDYAADGLSGDGYQGPASITIEANTVDSSNAYGIVAEGAPGGADSVSIASNTVNNEVSENGGTWGAPGILVDTGTFTISDNKLEGSLTTSGASNGASQEVCGPVTGSPSSPLDPVYYCSVASSLTTAAIQGSSENGADQTNMTLSGNTFTDDSNDMSTLGVLGGATNVLWI